MTRNYLFSRACIRLLEEITKQEHWKSANLRQSQIVKNALSFNVEMHRPTLHQ